MAVTIYRNEADKNSMIEKIDVADQERVEYALEDQFHEYCILSIDIDCVDESKNTPRI